MTKISAVAIPLDVKRPKFNLSPDQIPTFESPCLAASIVGRDEDKGLTCSLAIWL